MLNGRLPFNDSTRIMSSEYVSMCVYFVFIYLFIYLFIISVYLFIHLYIYHLYLSMYLFYQFIYLCIYFTSLFLIYSFIHYFLSIHLISIHLSFQWNNFVRDVEWSTSVQRLPAVGDGRRHEDAEAEI